MTVPQTSLPTWVFRRGVGQRFLVAVQPDNTATIDGGHVDPQGVAKARVLFERIACIRPPAGTEYVMVTVDEVPDYRGALDERSIAATNLVTRATAQVPSSTILDEASSGDTASSSEAWVVWSNEHDAWWGPNRSGYETSLLLAGVYEEAEARKIEHTRSRPAGAPVPERAMRLADALQAERGMRSSPMKVADLLLAGLVEGAPIAMPLEVAG